MDSRFGACYILVFFEQVVPIVLQFGLMNQYQYASAASDACHTGAGDAFMLTDLHDEILFPEGVFFHLTEEVGKMVRYLSKKFNPAFLKSSAARLHRSFPLINFPAPSAISSAGDKLGD